MNNKPTITAFAQFSRISFVVLAWVLFICIVLQTFIAGMALFTDSAYWQGHVMFVHIFEFVPLLMLLFSFMGKLPLSLRLQSAGLFVLIFAQYFTAHFPGAGAVHPVLALILFAASMHIARRSQTYSTKRTAEK